jgi:hypothetical protein
MLSAARLKMKKVKIKKMANRRKFLFRKKSGKCTKLKALPDGFGYKAVEAVLF